MKDDDREFPEFLKDICNKIRRRLIKEGVSEESAKVLTAEIKEEIECILVGSMEIDL